MSQLASYKRYWEPSLAQVIGVSLPIGAFITVLTQPIEFVKTRIQIRAEGVGMVNKNHWMGYNSHKVFRQIHETGVGFRGLYVGIEAALISRLGYLLVRNIIYKTIYDSMKPRKVTNDLSGREKGVIAGLAGGIAAFVTTPTELIMTRQIADGGLPENIKRNYRGFTHAYQTILAEEGGRNALFKGGYATILRAVVMNASLTGPYDYLREKLWITFGDFGFIDVIPVFYAAAWATALTLPFDNLKTRMQKSFTDPLKNRIDYRSFRGCIIATMNVEGPLGFYVGAYPFYLKMLVTCGLTTWITSSVTDSWKKKKGLKEWQI